MHIVLRNSLDPDLGSFWIRIRIEVFGWIRIRIKWIWSETVVTLLRCEIDAVRLNDWLIIWKNWHGFFVRLCNGTINFLKELIDRFPFLIGLWLIAFNIDRWNIAKLKIKTGTVTSTRVPVVRNNFAIKLKIFHE